jgi:hypothetical protein
MWFRGQTELALWENRTTLEPFRGRNLFGDEPFRGRTEFPPMSAVRTSGPKTKRHLWLLSSPFQRSQDGLAGIRRNSVRPRKRSQVKLVCRDQISSWMARSDPGSRKNPTEKLSRHGHWASKPDGVLFPAHRELIAGGFPICGVPRAG